MIAKTTIAGAVLIGLGVLFFINQEIPKGAFKFYRMLYTKKNLKVMFKGLGIFLILAGLVLIFKA